MSTNKNCANKFWNLVNFRFPRSNKVIIKKDDFTDIWKPKRKLPNLPNTSPNLTADSVKQLVGCIKSLKQKK